MLVLEELSGKVIGVAIEVHRELGPGLLESSQEACLCEELRVRGIRWERQVQAPVRYKGITLKEAYRLEILVEEISGIHEAQMLTYLRHTGLKIALLINFNSVMLRDRIDRFVS